MVASCEAVRCGPCATHLGVRTTFYAATDKIMARSHGMLGIEIGVAIAVMAIVVSIYLNIISHGKYKNEE